MAKAWLQTSAEDYKRLGLKPGQVEVWEDGKRDDDRPFFTEWWYFDALTEDGTSIVVHFNTKTSGKAMIKHGATPEVAVSIQTPDGTEYNDVHACAESEASFSKEKCDVHFGKDYFTGNLKDYRIFVEPTNGIGVDLHLHNLRKSWRPKTGHLSFGSNKKYFTWLFVVPKGEISGTITYNGKTVKVTGSGYHDHQWGTMNPANFNSWVWGRQHFDDYTILMFDVITSKKYGYERVPIFCIEDAEGNVVFENTGMDAGFSCHIESEYYEKEIGKSYPKDFAYTFEHDGKKVTYSLKADRSILRQDIYHSGGKAMQTVMDLLKIQPAYARYKALGTLTIEENGEKTTRSGRFIYEFAYIAKSYREIMEVKRK